MNNTPKEPKNPKDKIDPNTKFMKPFMQNYKPKPINIKPRGRG